MEFDSAWLDATARVLVKEMLNDLVVHEYLVVSAEERDTGSTPMHFVGHRNAVLEAQRAQIRHLLVQEAIARDPEATRFRSRRILVELEMDAARTDANAAHAEARPWRTQYLRAAASGDAVPVPDATDALIADAASWLRSVALAEYAGQLPDAATGEDYLAEVVGPFGEKLETYRRERLIANVQHAAVTAVRRPLVQAAERQYANATAIDRMSARLEKVGGAQALAGQRAILAPLNDEVAARLDSRQAPVSPEMDAFRAAYRADVAADAALPVEIAVERSLERMASAVQPVGRLAFGDAVRELVDATMFAEALEAVLPAVTAQDAIEAARDAIDVLSEHARQLSARIVLPGAAHQALGEIRVVASADALTAEQRDAAIEGVVRGVSTIVGSRPGGPDARAVPRSAEATAARARAIMERHLGKPSPGAGLELAPLDKMFTTAEKVLAASLRHGASDRTGTEQSPFELLATGIRKHAAGRVRETYMERARGSLIGLTSQAAGRTPALERGTEAALEAQGAVGPHHPGTPPPGGSVARREPQTARRRALGPAREA